MIKIYSKNTLVQYFQIKDNIDELNDFLTPFNMYAEIGPIDAYDERENKPYSKTFAIYDIENNILNYINRYNNKYIVIEYNHSLNKHILKIYRDIEDLYKYYNIVEDNSNNQYCPICHNKTDFIVQIYNNTVTIKKFCINQNCNYEIQHNINVDEL